MTYIFRKKELEDKLKAEGFSDTEIQKIFNVTFNGFKRTTASVTVIDAQPVDDRLTGFVGELQ